MRWREAWSSVEPETQGSRKVLQMKSGRREVARSCRSLMREEAGGDAEGAKEEEKASQEGVEAAGGNVTLEVVDVDVEVVDVDVGIVEVDDVKFA